MDIFDLTAKISLDTSEYTSGLDGAENKASSFSSNLKNGIGKAAKVGAAAVGVMSAAVAATGAAMVKGVSDVAEYGDAIDKNSQKMGVSSKFYQEWDAVLQHSGTSMDSMSATFKTLAKAAQGASDTQEEAFKKLGLSMEEVSKMSTEEVFTSVISGLQGMEAGTERTALATALLGRGAMEMGALLNTSAEDTQKMIDTVNDLGGVMDEKAIKASARFQDSLQDLQTGLTGAKNNLAAEFLPAVADVMDGLTALFSGDGEGIGKINEGLSSIATSIGEAIPKISEAVSGMVPVIVKTITEGLPILATAAVDIIKALGKGLKDNLSQIIQSATEILMLICDTIIDLAPQLLQTGLGLILQLALGIADALPTLIPKMIDAIVTMVETLVDNADMLIDGAIALIMGLADGIISALPRLIEKAPIIIVKLVAALIRNAPKLVVAAFEIMAKMGMGLVDNIQLLIKHAPDIIKKVAEELKANFDKIKDVGKNLIEGLWNGINDKIAWIKDKIATFGETVLNSIKDIFGIHSPSKEMAKIGGFLAEGLQQGWDAEASGVVDSINKDLAFTASVKGTQNAANSLSVEKDYIDLENALAGAIKRVLDDYTIEWDERTLGRLVRNYVL